MEISERKKELFHLLYHTSMILLKITGLCNLTSCFAKTLKDPTLCNKTFVFCNKTVAFCDKNLTHFVVIFYNF